MNPEKFDPHNPEYKKVEDLPQEHQAEFADVEGGFVRKEAIEEYRRAEAKTKQENSQRSFVDKSLGKNKMTSLDILHKAGLVENKKVVEKEQKDQKDQLEKKKEEERITGKEKERLEKEKAWDDFIEKNREYLSKEAPKLIREQGVSVLKEINQRAEGFIKSYDGVVEEVARFALKLQKSGGGDFNELVNETGRVFIGPDSEKEYESWSHSLCHLFEDYGKEGRESYLNNEANLGIAQELIDKAVRQCVNEKTIGSIGRIIGPLPVYNIVEAVNKKRFDSFVLKPESLTQDEFLKIAEFNPKYNNGLILFLSASNPRELISSFVRSKEDLDKFLSLDQVKECLSMAMEDVGQAEVAAYVRSRYGISGENILTKITENLSLSKSLEGGGVESGVFVDVEGTLIREGNLDSKIVSFLEKTDKPVIIFTGGNPLEATSRLRELGLSERFLPVLKKDDFRGKTLEHLIDDTPHAEYQGMKAVKHEIPR